MEKRTINLSELHFNEGQVEGVPENPRIIGNAELDALRSSIKANPEMLELRELVVFPQGETYVVLGGNQRLRAMTDLGYTDAVCKVLPKDMPAEKLRAIVIKDNNFFGEFDVDSLVDWPIDDLAEIGFDFLVEAGEEMPDEDEGLTKEQEAECQNIRDTVVCPDCGGEFLIDEGLAE